MHFQRQGGIVGRMETTPRALRILMLSAGRVAGPVSGGELRIHHLAAELGRLGHRVELVGLVARNHPRRRLDAQGLAAEERHSWRLDLALLADRLRLAPACELPLWLAGLGRELARRVAVEEFDIIQCELPWWLRAAEAVRGRARIVYGAHNIEADWWAPRLARFPLGASWRRRLEAQERRAIERSDGVIACCAADANWMQGNTRLEPARLAVVANGFDARRIAPPDAESRRRAREKFGFAEDEKVALFIGADVKPNRQAARVIAGKIAPALRGEPIRLVVAGRVARSLEPAAGVTLLGPVEDSLELLHAADLALNPMQSGSGSNIKLIEALGAGLPVVTTPFGMRGFEALADRMLVGEVPEMARLIREARRGDPPPPRAPLEEFSWAAAAARLDRHYQRLLELPFKS